MGCCQIQSQNDLKGGTRLDNEDLLSVNIESSKNVISFENDHRDKINLEKMLKKKKKIKSIDIVFLLDCTASMTQYMGSVKKLLKQIISDADSFIRKRNMSDEALNIGCVTYSDHSQSSVYDGSISKLYPFNCSFYAEYYIDELKFKGGEDDHEAVSDGLYDAVYKLDWNENSEKFLLHICDAPPHGNIYKTNGLTDDFPQGCPCGKKEEETLKKMTEMEIKYIVVKLNSCIDKMITVFNRHIDVDVITPDFKVEFTEKVSQYN
jgi:hypothetical protein